MTGPDPAAAPLRSFVFADLHKSSLNVRRNKEDSEATEALEASIARVGLLVPLIVHPADAAAPTPWGVLAGGRRLRAIGQLIAAGRLPADWPIAAKVAELTDAKVTEASLSENLIRRDLRPYEVHAAIADAHDQGDSVEEIAAQLGQTPAWVRRHLRLGKLARPIFDAYAGGDLSFDQASAYAATADTDLQLEVWEAHRQLSGWQHSAARIRAALKVGDREAARLLLFVGEAVYLGAGGMVEPDLFADGGDARVRITDEALLRELAEERFAVERDRIRKTAERPALRFATEPPQFSGRTDEALAFLDGPPPLAHVPTDAIVATIDVDDRGAPHTRFWWTSRAAKGAADRGRAAPAPTVNGPEVKGGEALAMPDSAYAQNGRAIAKDEYGLTADGLQIMRSLRRALLRRLLIEQGGSVANDYLVWAQARLLAGKSLPAQTGCRAIAGEWHDGADRPPPGLFESYAADVPAEQDWQAALAGLRARPFMTEKDPARSLEQYLALPVSERTGAAAIVAGIALLRSADTPGWRIAAHDVLARACIGPGVSMAATLRRWWSPSAKWLGLFGRMFRLAAAQPFVERDTFAGFTKLKDRELTDAVTTALDPELRKDPAIRARVERWLPDLLAFGPASTPDGAAPADPVAEQRAALKNKLKASAAGKRPREPAA